jgi:hypothetical protein
LITDEVHLQPKQVVCLEISTDRPIMVLRLTVYMYRFLVTAGC